jgi:hypothetical protein
MRVAYANLGGDIMTQASVNLDVTYIYKLLENRKYPEMDFFEPVGIGERVFVNQVGIVHVKTPDDSLQPVYMIPLVFREHKTWDGVLRAYDAEGNIQKLQANKVGKMELAIAENGILYDLSDHLPKPLGDSNGINARVNSLLEANAYLRACDRHVNYRKTGVYFGYTRRR